MTARPDNIKWTQKEQDRRARLVVDPDETKANRIATAWVQWKKTKAENKEQDRTTKEGQEEPAKKRRKTQREKYRNYKRPAVISGPGELWKNCRRVINLAMWSGSTTKHRRADKGRRSTGRQLMAIGSAFVALVVAFSFCFAKEETSNKKVGSVPSAATCGRWKRKAAPAQCVPLGGSLDFL